MSVIWRKPVLTYAVSVRTDSLGEFGEFGEFLFILGTLWIHMTQIGAYNMLNTERESR